MSIRIINGKVYKNGAFSEEEIVLKEGKIVSAQDGDAEEVYDAKGNYVVPGFIDVHTHGGAGVDVNAADQQGFEKIGHFFATQGTTSWLSSILTDTKEQTLKTIKEAVKHQEAQKNGQTELSVIKLIQYVFGYAKVNFGSIATIVRGSSPRPIKNYITENCNGVNWIKIGDIKPNTKYVTATAEKITKEGAKKSRFVHPGDFILSNSMSFGRPYILKIEGCIHDGWLSISNFNDIVIPDYLYHLLNSNSVQQEMKQRASFGGAVQNLNADIVKSLKLNIPSLEVQKHIVSILDRFDTLCNDLSAGLPAEIEARQKQYEYYRDMLLSFKELPK